MEISDWLLISTMIFHVLCIVIGQYACFVVLKHFDWLTQPRVQLISTRNYIDPRVGQ